MKHLWFAVLNEGAFWSRKDGRTLWLAACGSSFDSDTGEVGHSRVTLVTCESCKSTDIYKDLAFYLEMQDGGDEFALLNDYVKKHWESYIKRKT